MKRLIFCAALVMAALASCSKTEVIYDGDSQEIGFKVAAGPMSKAPLTSTILPTDSNMVVYAYSSSTENGPYTSYFDNQIFKYQDSYWKGQPPQYWPKSGYLKFRAFYPSGIGTPAVNDTGAITISSISNKVAQVDILYTDTTAAMPCTTTDFVPMTFKHALAQIVVTAKVSNPNMNNVKVTNVQIVEPNVSGTLVLNSSGKGAKWTSTDIYGNIEMNNNISENILSGSAATLGVGALVIPGEQTSLRVTYTVGGLEKIETISLSESWVMGKKYIYNLTISLNEILISAEVEDWDAQNNSKDVTID